MRLRILLLPLLLLTLAGCGPGSKVGDLISVATSTVTNPVDAVDVYRLKNGYAATLELVVQYRRFCWSKPYQALMADPVAQPVCAKRRAVVRAVNQYGPTAKVAIRTAENFVRDNPTINASGVITAAWTALEQFRQAVPRTQ